MKKAKYLKGCLILHFGEVQLEINNKWSYLGMQIEIMKKELTVIDMTFYVKQLIEGMEVENQKTPVVWLNDKSIIQKLQNYYFWLNVQGLIYILYLVSCVPEYMNVLLKIMKNCVGYCVISS